MPFDEAIGIVRDGRITNAKSIAGLLWAEKWGLLPLGPEAK